MQVGGVLVWRTGTSHGGCGRHGLLYGSAHVDLCRWRVLRQVLLDRLTGDTHDSTFNALLQRILTRPCRRLHGSLLFGCARAAGLRKQSSRGCSRRSPLILRNLVDQGRVRLVRPIKLRTQIARARVDRRSKGGGDTRLSSCLASYNVLRQLSCQGPQLLATAPFAHSIFKRLHSLCISVRVRPSTHQSTLALGHGIGGSHRSVLPVVRLGSARRKLAVAIECARVLLSAHFTG